MPQHRLPTPCHLLPPGPESTEAGTRPSDGSSVGVEPAADATGGREAALFVTRDGGVGIIQVR